MKINGLNLKNNYSVSDPIKQKQSKKEPSFSGHVLTQDSHGEDVYKFNLPNAPKGTTLVLAIMTPDKNGDYKISQAPFEWGEKLEGFNSIEIPVSLINLEKDQALGYKFLVGGKTELTDNSVRGDGFNIATPINRANPTRPRQMEHILIDSFNITDFAKKTKRNHFNLLGGTLNSVNEKIDDLAKAGIRNILGTPIFGQDNKSSHGYWTTNPYQITNNLGSLADFNNLMVNLYKHNMSWTADGAFVNEGLEGIHIEDMINYGQDSPFIHMFETKDIGNEPFKFGILSKNDEVEKHTHIQLMNAPYKIVFKKAEDGTYKEDKIIKNPNYTTRKPTYIQVFDDRLASESQMNGDERFNVYANKDSGDNLEIANYKDSVQAYNRRVEPKNVKDNYEKYLKLKNHNPDIEFKNTLKEWPNFKIETSNKDGGVSLWVGNSDIAKKRFVVFESVLDGMNLSKEEKQLIKAAQYQVQDDTIQVGKFWTSEVSRKLTEYTAHELAEKLGDEKSQQSFEKAIKQLIEEGKLAPQVSAVMASEGSKGSPLKNILSTNFMGDRDYSLKTKKLPESLTDGLMSYPLDAIEFSPDLSTIFAYPYIKNLAVTDDTVGMSRFDMFKMGDKYYNQMPDRYKVLYKEMDDLYANDMTTQAKSIMSDLQDKTGVKYFTNDGKLNQQGREVYSLVAPDIAKFLVVSALAPNVKPKSNDTMLEYDVKDLNKVNTCSLGLQYEVSPEDAAKSLINKLQVGLNNIDVKTKKSFVDSLAHRVANVDSDVVNVAKLIVEKTESGLDWRIDAAKDVADWDSEEAGFITKKQNMDFATKFWNKYNSAVRDYNPSSYTIGELTDINDDVIPKSQFLQKSGFTTLSDYEWFYGALPAIYGQNADGENKGNIYQTVSDKFSSYKNSGFAEHVNFAHRFVGNQDKPRITHLLSMDVGSFNKDKVVETKRILGNAINGSAEFNSLSDDLKDAFWKAFDLLSEGSYMKDGKFKDYDNENYGVRPFEFTLDSVINSAKEMSPEFKSFVDSHKNKIEKLEAEVYKNIVSSALAKNVAITFAQVGLPGNPTTYAGDELGMTGWETACKNEKQENRNALRWDWLNDPNYKFIKDYYDEISKIRNVRNDSAASALVNGATIELYPQVLNNKAEAIALYRYNDKTDAIVVLHNSCFGSQPEQYGEDNSYIDSIKLGGLPMGLPSGTVFVNALDKTQHFMVKDGARIEYVDEKGNRKGDINLGRQGIILVREKDFKGKDFPSFKGRIENANVKLANTKYNFAYMAR